MGLAGRQAQPSSIRLAGLWCTVSMRNLLNYCTLIFSYRASEACHKQTHDWKCFCNFLNHKLCFFGVERVINFITGDFVGCAGGRRIDRRTDVSRPSSLLLGLFLFWTGALH